MEIVITHSNNKTPQVRPEVRPGPSRPKRNTDDFLTQK